MTQFKPDEKNICLSLINICYLRTLLFFRNTVINADHSPGEKKEGGKIFVGQWKARIKKQQ